MKREEKIMLLKLIIGVFIFFILIGIVGHYDYQDIVLKEMETNGWMEKMHEEFPNKDAYELVDIYIERGLDVDNE